MELVSLFICEDVHTGLATPDGVQIEDVLQVMLH